VTEERPLDAVDEWLGANRDALAAAAGLAPEELRLDRHSIEILLDLARIAAHDSGDRRNAPLLCYLVGKAEREVALEALAAAVREAG